MNTVITLAENSLRVTKKVSSILKPMDDRDSQLIDLNNHLETLLQEIISACKENDVE